MTDYLEGLEYDAELDVLAHAISNVTPGVYSNPTRMQIDDMGHVVDISSGGFDTGYIEGLAMEYAGPDYIGLFPGAAYVPGYNRVVTLEAYETRTIFPSPGANGIRYVYLDEVNGIGQVHVSDVAPALPYFGNARTMTGDNTKRYLGMLKWSAAGVMLQFDHKVFGGATTFVLYGFRHNNALLRVVDNYSSTTLARTNIGPAGTDAAKRLVGPGARTAWMYVLVEGISGVGNGYVGEPSLGVVNAPGVKGHGDGYMFARLNAGDIAYHVSTTGVQLTAYVAGYYEDR